MKNFLILLMLLLGSTASQASLINYSGTFSGIFSIGPIPEISGSWSVFFDDSGLLGSGGESSGELTPTSFSLTPNPLGATLFDSSNVGVELVFGDGSLVNIYVGGLLNGVQFATSGTDFVVDYESSGEPTLFAYRIETIGGVTENILGSFTATSVSIPEPTTLILMTLGLVSMAYRRCRERAH